MTPELIEAATALADTLARENAALALLDLPRAGGLLAEKQRSAEAFARAQAAADLAAAFDAEQQRLAAAIATRLSDLAQENRRLLERALGVQRRVLNTVARAAAKAVGRAPRYGATGALAPGRQAPVVVSARV
jgi:hypothetical protein